MTDTINDWERDERRAVGRTLPESMREPSWRERAWGELDYEERATVRRGRR